MTFDEQQAQQGSTSLDPAPQPTSNQGGGGYGNGGYFDPWSWFFGGGW
jgi:hypothetical protein